MPFYIDRYDSKKQKEGVWLEYEGSRFLIRCQNTPEYLRISRFVSGDAGSGLSHVSQGLSFENGEYDPELHEHRLMLAVAKVLLIDWDGVKNAEGSHVEPSIENRYRALVDNPLFRVWVTIQSNTLENYHSDAHIARLAAAQSEKAQKPDSEAA
ncbi:hypothetical protein [Salinicola salarius]|uniref:hypothetical protein n=1 Tax=Salinicola salarius TaxID=430457 RepID=UPI0026ECF200|nr:hypothetical protein [Salinicola salarius]